MVFYHLQYLFNYETGPPTSDYKRIFYVDIYGKKQQHKKTKQKKEATQLGFSSKYLFLSWVYICFLHLTTESISFRLFFAFRLCCCQNKSLCPSYKFSVTFLFCYLAPYWLDSSLIFYLDTSTLLNSWHSISVSLTHAPIF